LDDARPSRLKNAPRNLSHCGRVDGAVDAGLIVIVLGLLGSGEPTFKIAAPSDASCGDTWPLASVSAAYLQRTAVYWPHASVQNVGAAMA
jgi:hypothetical protein